MRNVIKEYFSIGINRKVRQLLKQGKLILLLE